MRFHLKYLDSLHLWIFFFLLENLGTISLHSCLEQTGWSWVAAASFSHLESAVAFFLSAFSLIARFTCFSHLLGYLDACILSPPLRDFRDQSQPLGTVPSADSKPWYRLCLMIFFLALTFAHWSTPVLWWFVSPRPNLHMKHRLILCLCLSIA